MFRVFYLLGVFCLIVPTVRLPLVPVGISDAFILAALAVWFWNYWRYHSQGGWGLPNHILWVSAILLLLGGMLSTFLAVRPLTSLLITFKTIFVVSIWVSLSMLMVRRGDLHLTIAVFVVAVCTSSGIAVIDRWFGTRWGDIISGNQAIYYYRSIGTFGHPNDLGAASSTVLPLILGILLLALKRQRRLFSVVLAGAFVVSGLGLFYSGSVAGWIGAVISIGVMGVIWFLRASVGLRSAVILGLLVLVAAGVFFFGESSRQAQVQFLLDYNLSRVSTITGPDRTRLILNAFEVISKNPFVGAGLDQTGTGGLTSYEYVTGQPIHNTLVGGWLGGGLLVFLGLATAYLVAFVTALRAMRWGLQTGDWLAVGLGAGVLGWIFLDQTQPSLSHRYSWLTLAWLFAMGFETVWSARSNVEVSRVEPARLRAEAVGGP